MMENGLNEVEQRENREKNKKNIRPNLTFPMDREFPYIQ